MARLTRVERPSLPHHVTPRANRRERTIFGKGDDALHPDLPVESGARAAVRAWRLISNHVQIILVPSDRDGLRCRFGRLHRRCAGFIDARVRTTGRSWQGRSGSVAVDETKL